MQRLSSILAGTSTGLLLGVLVGLSVSAVVGSVVGGVVALLATFLGFKDDAPAAEASPDTTDARRFGVAAFGFACLVGVVASLVLRTHNTLAMSPKQQVREWTDAGYPEAEARSIVALKSAGIVPTGVSVQKRSAVDEAAGGVLFAADVKYCDQLNPRDYSDAANLARAFAGAGGAWKSYSEAVARVQGDTTRLALLKAAWGLVCR